MESYGTRLSVRHFKPETPVRGMKCIKKYSSYRFLVFVVLMLCGYCVQSRDLLDDKKTPKLGLYPSIVNLAASSRIGTNATCGENGPENFCKLVEHVHRISRRRKRSQCDLCSNTSHRQRHDIEYAIDGKGGRWWQSPSINNGYQYHWITITLDMKQVFQVAYFILKAANSPRPGNWILEKSLDGVDWQPWQYFALSDAECLRRYPARVARIGSPRLLYDNEVVCTSYFSKLIPLQNGEIHISLINGRPTAENPSRELIDFTSARYVRLRFQQIRTLLADLMTLKAVANRSADHADPSVTTRYFYSVKDISIGGMCICHGHAHDCPSDPLDGKFVCQCEHGTTGDNCEKCLPMFNQYKWRPGNDGSRCEECNCNGRASSCYYDENVDRRRESLDARGFRRGGGVCIDCQDFTAGINCDSCVDGYYRPLNVLPSDRVPCRPCECDAAGTRTTADGSLRICRKLLTSADGERDEALPGDCYCKKGFAGRSCNRCDVGFRGYPDCQPCPCDAAGSLNEDPCVGECICKANVTGDNCDQCKPGYFNLDPYSESGCEKCYCSGVASTCDSSTLRRDLLRGLRGWTIVDRAGSRTVTPSYDETLDESYAAHEATTDAVCTGIYYWTAPSKYLGNKLSSYGGELRYTIYYELPMSTSTSMPFNEVDVILEGNGVALDLSFQRTVRPYISTPFVALLKEGAGWIEANSRLPASREQILQVLTSARRLLVRASYNRDGNAVFRIRDFSMDLATPTGDGEPIASVEECNCPVEYSGMSCEDCALGHYRSRQSCTKCECHGHAITCNPYTGVCEKCQHGTTGLHCELCLPGYYGDATRWHCRRCACPLVVQSNNFSPTCSFDDLDNTVVCHGCRRGYEGLRCERCSAGYYGNPIVPGDVCRPCECNGNSFSCDPASGRCLACMGNTAGSHCEQCAAGYYGDAVSMKDCTRCSCDPDGSFSARCDRVTGQCSCRPGLFGKRCNLCADDQFLDRDLKACVPCLCNTQGTLGYGCGPTGDCACKQGVSGRNCDRCRSGYYNFGNSGCAKCDCSRTNGHCNPVTGACMCPPFTTGYRCAQCIPNSYGWDASTGCQECSCHGYGSKSSQCNAITGDCICKSEYSGKQCNSCKEWFYDFPNCLPCACNAAGTRPSSCAGGPEGACACGHAGQCQCKGGVVGLKCDRCAEGAFSLQRGNPRGCTDCFCFGVTDECSQAQYHWGDAVSLSVSSPVAVANRINTRSTTEGVSMSANAKMVTMDPTVVRRSLRYGPYYWRLPPQFNGDKLMSYGGQLVFTIYYSARIDNSPHANSPTVVIRGRHNGTSISYKLEEPENRQSKSYALTMSEHDWTYLDSDVEVSRGDFTMVLHDIEYFLIKASYGEFTDLSRLSDVFLDVAVKGTSGRGDSSLRGPPALGIEMCVCPPGYIGLSCQECNVGYTRIRTGTYLGECRPCACNGKSNRCDAETGVCLSCSGNFTGDRCDYCLSGFYLTSGPTGAVCKKCACPLLTPENNFSPTCVPARFGDYVCNRCPTGYEGPRCERCSVGYYGDPTSPGSYCKKCGCNAAGSISTECDRVTGKCECVPGVTGHVCDECRPGHAITGDGCIKCDDDCSGKLRKEVEALTTATRAVDLENMFPPPWNKLMRLENNSNGFEIFVDKTMTDVVDTLILVQEISPDMMSLNSSLNAAKKRSKACYLDVDDVRSRTSRAQRRIERKAKQSDDALQQSENLASRMGRLLGRLGEGIDFDDSEIVSRIADLIRELRNRRMFEYRTTAYEELELARGLRGSIEGNFTRPTRRVSNDIDRTKEWMANRVVEIQDKLKELLAKGLAAGTVEKDARKRNNRNNNTIRQLLASFEKKRNEILIMEAARNDALHLLNETEFKINEARNYVEQIKMQGDKLKDLLQDLKTESDKIASVQAQLDILRGQVRDAQLKAQELLNVSSYFQSVYDRVSGLSMKQTDAVARYLRIAEAIETANTTANAALQLAMNSLPSQLDDSSIVTLLTEVKNMKKTVEEQRRSLKKSRSPLRGWRATIHDLSERRKKLKRGLDVLDVDFPEDEVNLATKTSKEANEITQEVEATTSELAKSVKNIDEAVETSKKYNEIIEGVKNNLKEIPVSLASATDASGAARVKQARVSVKSGEVQKKIVELRRQIEESRMKASSIRAASVKSEGKCSMRYLLTVSPSRVTEIVLQIMPETADNTLFYMGRDEGDYILVSTRSGRVHVTWDLGSGRAEIVNPVNVQKSKDTEKDWYRIELYRMDQAMNVTVFRKANRTGTSVTVSQSSPGKSTLFDVDERDYLFIGGVPDYVKFPIEVPARSFTGCMGEAYLQGKLVGLWNFREVSHPSHCSGCAQLPVERSTIRTVYGYNGRSYSLLQYFMTRLVDTRITVADMGFKTLSSSGLLIYMGSSTTNDFISVEFEEGHLVTRVDLGNGIETMRTERAYNSGRWLTLFLRRFESKVRLKVTDIDGGEMKEIVLNGTDGHLNTTSNDLLCVGGCPTDLVLSTFYGFRISAAVSRNGYIGCIRNFKLMNAAQPLRGASNVLRYSAVDTTCPKRVVRDIGIETGGFVELPGHPLSVTGSVSITFNSREPDALLLLATDGISTRRRRRRKRQPNANFYSLSLSGGHVEARLRAVSGSPLVLRSNLGRYSDGDEHTALLWRRRDLIQLIVDDNVDGMVSGTLFRGERLDLATSRLYVGGLPESVQIKDMAGSGASINGCMRELVTDRLVDFKHATSVAKSYVGTCAYTPTFPVLPPRRTPAVSTTARTLAIRSTTPAVTPSALITVTTPSVVIEKPTTTDTTGCVAEGELPTLRKPAVRFGQSPYSHMEFAHKEDVSARFRIQIEFRTLASHGVLLYASGEEHDFFSLQLKNGKPVFLFDSGKGPGDAVGNFSVNDGKWHTIRISRSKRKGLLKVDGMRYSMAKSPKGANQMDVTKILYVGGVRPGTDVRGLAGMWQSLDSCVRSVSVNKARLNMRSPSMAHDIGSCYEHIEEGAYFNGKGYAIYSNEYRVGPEMAIELEFRTWARDGAIVSISDSSRSDGLALELVNGSISFRVNNGAGDIVARYTPKVDAPSGALCDGRWHKIKATKSKYLLTLTVDGHFRTNPETSRGDQNSADTEDPLYIGGCPDDAFTQKQLSTKAKFVGCMKNLKLKGQTVDFSQVYKYRDIYPSSCPRSNGS